MVDAMAQNKKHHEKLKVVMIDGKEVAFNPEEEEDPRLVKAIMEAEKEESIGPMTLEEFRKMMNEDED
jgi:hypothetical protein